MGSKTPAGGAHLPQLDGLRAFAVLAVLFTHFLPPGDPFREFAYWGDGGVQLFFVLSGYLITGILLRCRRIMAGGQSLGSTLIAFYVRRALRIFPLFYLTILLCSLFDLGGVRQTWPWHVFYASNFAVVWSGEPGGHWAHFWSLAVEEQFYFVWPLLILALPARWLPRAIILAILAAPAFRLAMSLLPVPWPARVVLAPACLDTLGAGALLAWLQDDRAREPWLARIKWGWGLGGAAFLIGLKLADTTSGLASAAYVVFGRLAAAGVFLCLVDAASRGIPGVPGRILSHSLTRYLGRISYGIYVLHHFMLDVIGRLGVSLSTDTVGGVWVRFGLLTAMSVAAAAVSWALVEKPLNDLKDRFPYRRHKQPSSGSPP
jgi:peptidoglycan/LPS O-acetylase OafA/YrhL